MRPTYLILILVAVIMVVGIFMTGSPEHAERLSEMRRNAAFTGEARQIALLVLAIGIGGFIVYLTMTRR